MSLKKLAFLTSLFSLFTLIYLNLAVKTSAQTPNDIVVGVGNKDIVTIRIVGPTTPTPIIQPSTTPVPSGFCTSDSQCLPSQQCAGNICIYFDCPAPPECKMYTASNHQCLLINRPDGYVCYNISGNIAGACRSGSCVFSSPTPTPVTATLPVQPTITPVPSGFCTSNVNCPSTQYCNPATQRCTDIVCQTPPLCRRFVISNYTCNLINEPNGTVCTDSVGTGYCQNGNCLHIVISATGIPTQSPSRTPAPSRIPSITSSVPNPTKPPKPTSGKDDEQEEKEEIEKEELEPEDDASVDERRPDTNFGRRAISEVEGKHGKQHYMKFKIGKAVGKKIVSAKLQLRVANFFKATQNIRFVDDSNWSEDKITYNNRPATGDIIGTMTSSGQFGRYINVNLDPKAISTADENLTIEIDTPGKWAFHLFSKESFFKPKLILEYAKQ